MRRNGVRFGAALLAGAIGMGMAGTGTARAEPGGCLKYGAAGAVGGHFAHHHAVLGAMGGCAVGMWRRHEYRKKERIDARKYREGLYRQQGLNNSGR